VSCYACHGPDAEGVRDIPPLGGLAYFNWQGRLEQWGHGYHSGKEFPMLIVASKLGSGEIEALGLCGVFVPHRDGTLYMTLRRLTLARLLFAVVCLYAAPAFADDLSGQASVIDGDTLEIHGARIRLWGIDAPESSQLCRSDESLQYQCGAEAANELDAFIARRPVDCSPVSLDEYGRTVAACSVDGVDIAEWLVRNGLALDWPLYSNGKYDKSQSEADHAGHGIWAGSYVAPGLFRACIRQGGKPGDCSDDANMHP